MAFIIYEQELITALIYTGQAIYCTYNSTMRCVHANTVALEKQ